MTSSICHTHTIKTAWSTIESFLDLPSTIAVSQTCRALHDEIVDADSQQVKVSHFTAGYGIHCQTIPHYLPFALNAIHFPTLRRIDLSFRHYIKSRTPDADDNREDATASCFPLFVSQLACAHNLKSLHLNVDFLMNGTNKCRFEPIIELFGRNLARCKKLEELVIIGNGGYSPSLMRVLVLALTPVLTQRRNVMRLIQFNIKGSPMDSKAPVDQSDTLHTAAINFFHSILCCPGLVSLDINIPDSFSLTNALMDAARSISPREKHSFKNQNKQVVGSDLQRLCLCLYGMYWYSELMVQDEAQYLENAGILLEHFSSCMQIKDVKLGFSSIIWNSNSDAVAKLLHNKPKLSNLALNFSRCRDDDGYVLELLKDCIMDKETKKCKIAELAVVSLNQVNGKRWCKLMQDIKNADGDIREMHGRNSNDNKQIVSRKTEREGIPAKIDVDGFLMKHATNVERSERD